jgi:hypothetical protein
MPQETKSIDHTLTHAPTLQGLFVSGDDKQALLTALEQAFDYRGDVTIITAAGDTKQGFLFDRTTRDNLEDSTLRLMTPNEQKPCVIRYSEIASIEFTGKDPAHGKSFDTWVKKYTEKKLAGEDASIYSDTADNNASS